jgi:hypothetical protein
MKRQSIVVPEFLSFGTAAFYSFETCFKKGEIMKVFQVVVIVVVIVGIAFGIGYFMGAIKISEMNTKITSLTEELKDKDFRILLLQVKDQVRESSKDISERNFGIADQKISAAREVLSKGIEGISEKGKASIGRIDTFLIEVHNDMGALNVRVKDKINTVTIEIDKALMSGI